MDDHTELTERTVTTRDGFVTEFNAQSDAEARAYKSGWVDCLSEIRDEDGLWEEHIEAVWEFARDYARTSGDSPDCGCVACRAHRAVEFRNHADKPHVPDAEEGFAIGVEADPDYFGGDL